MEAFTQGLTAIIIMLSMASCLAQTPTNEPVASMPEESEQLTEADTASLIDADFWP